MIRELIKARALELATHDGVPVAVIHLHGAASNLVAEIAREKDAAITDLARSAVAAPIAAPLDAAVAIGGNGAAPGEPAGDVSTEQVSA